MRIKALRTLMAVSLAVLVLVACAAFWAGGIVVGWWTGNTVYGVAVGVLDLAGLVDPEHARPWESLSQEEAESRITEDGLSGVIREDVAWYACAVLGISTGLLSGMVLAGYGPLAAFWAAMRVRSAVSGGGWDGEPGGR